MTIIESLMKTELVTVTADETVAHAAWSMARNGVGAVLVLESDSLMGVLSERDVVVRVVAEGLDPTETKVAEVATALVASVDVSATVRECAQRIQAEGIRHLPILRDGKPVGILSTRDFFAYVVEGLDRMVEHGNYEKAIAEGQDPYDHLGGSYGG
jgi:CBS domain-containing protein